MHLLSAYDNVLGLKQTEFSSKEIFRLIV